MKPCRKCGADDRRPCGNCRPCDNARAAKAYAANPEKKRSVEKARYAAKPDAIRAVVRAYRAANPEKVKASAASWRAANPDRLREGQRAYAKQRKSVDLSFRLRASLRTRMYMALRGGYKAGSAVRDLGCTIHELRAYLEARFRPGMTWENWGKGLGKWNIDHIKPLASFDLTDRAQLLTACHYTNLQPLWAEENLAKSDHV